VTDRLIHLRGAGASLVLDATAEGLPRVVYWGADLGDGVDLAALALATTPPIARATLDVRVPLSLLPERAAGHRGRPGLTGSRDGRAWSSSFRFLELEQPDADGAVVAAEDPGAGLALRSELRLAPSGLLALRHTLRNDGDAPYRLDELACVLPVPAVAREVLDLTGRWCRERSPQRRELGHGTWLRESRHGRTGHDATLMLVAGTPGFGFRTGEVWGVHLGWSGDASTWAERLPDGGAVLGAAELLGPGEVLLEPGQEYSTPWLYAAWSPRGLDGLSAATHAWLRARPGHRRRPRPVVLNTWEAVYFDHRLDRLAELADTAARLGVERFVLDDGWFGARRDDTAGLGDWRVSADVWPDGLGPLVEHVRGLGMELGLWVEPEMVNPDSDVFRAHPDWVMRGPGGRLPPPWRNEQVLDLANPDAYAHVRDLLDVLLGEYEIAYLKWDHNRDLVEAGHGGRPGVHEQTLAAYYDTERRRPEFFKSVRARESPERDFPLQLVARATASAPTYFEPLLLGDRPLIDGGVFAVNPGMCALAEVLRYSPGAEVVLVSLGTGQLTRPFPWKEVRGWGLVEWARPLIDVVFDGASDVVDYQLTQVLGPQHFFRFQTELTAASDDLDDASAENLRALRLTGERLLEERARDLEAALAALAG
jgi:alpha-galactosidase